MSSSAIKSLRAPPSVDLSIQRATEALNAQFSSVDDLDDLESIALQARDHSNQLEEELSASQASLDDVLTQTRTSAERYLSTAKELSLTRHYVADELSDLSKELISVMSDEGTKPTLLEDLETLHRNLKELESVKAYVQIVQHALRTSESAVQDVRSAPSISTQSLNQYEALLHFIADTGKSCSTIQESNGDQSLHLMSFLEQIRHTTWHNVKGCLSSALLDSAEKLGWPMAIDYASCTPPIRQAFESAFLKLLRLQSIGRKLHKKHNIQSGEEDGLYPIKALVQPVAQRFKYHFDGTRQTNRLDKPEWYFTHVLNIAHEQHHFMDTVVQDLLSQTEYKGISGWREFALLLLPLLTRKLKKTIPSLLTRPSLFAHTIYQALIFDAAYVEEGFELENTSAAQDTSNGDKSWDGISEVILGNPEWFNAWLQAEKKFVEDQYHEIISAPDAWVIADEDEEEIIARDVKATNSARRIRALVNQITDRFSPLPSPIQRTHFLISVQLPLLDHYRARISSSLDAFETLSYAFIRAVPGALSVSLSVRDESSVNVDARNLTSGVEGVQRLCKALLSATYIHASLESWSEEVFFLELWQDILREPVLRDRADECHLLPEVASSSSTGNAAAQNTLFDELMFLYKKLVTRAEDMALQQVCGEIEAGLRAHFIASAGLSAGEPTDGIGISQTLLGPIALLSSHLSFLRSTLPQATFTTLYRRIASRLSEHILQRHILYRGSFSWQEAVAINAECELWVETCQTALAGILGGGRQRVEAPWAKLLQASRLVGAGGEVWETITSATFGTQNDADWEKVMLETTGLAEMGREDVSNLLRRRADCP